MNVCLTQQLIGMGIVVELGEKIYDATHFFLVKIARDRNLADASGDESPNSAPIASAPDTALAAG